MKDMLFLSQRLPYPPNKGDKIRSFNILKHFAKTHRIHLGCFIDDPMDWEHVPALREYCADTCILPLNKTAAKIRSLKAFLTGDPLNLPYFHSTEMAQWTSRVLTDIAPGTAFAFSSQMAQYFLDARPRPERIVIDYCDVDSDKWRQYAKSRSWPMNWVYDREGRKLLEYDRMIAREIDAGTFVADPEVEVSEKDTVSGACPERGVPVNDAVGDTVVGAGTGHPANVTHSPRTPNSPSKFLRNSITDRPPVYRTAKTIPQPFGQPRESLFDRPPTRNL